MPGWFDSATLSAGASHVLPVLLDAAVKSLIVLVPAVAATAVMRRSSAAARHFVWFLAVAGLLILPVLSGTLPGWQILPRWIDLSADAAPDVAAFQPLESESPAPVTIGWSNEPAGPRDSFEPTTAPPAAIGEVEATPDQLTTDRQEAAAIAPEPEEPRFAEGPQPSPARVLLACVPLVWMTGTLLVVGWLCLGAAIMRRLSRRCEPIVDGSWTALLGRLSAELKLKRSVRLLRSDRRSMPMAWGFFKPRLLLPAEASSWPADRRRVVLLHELAHIKRRDPLTQFVTQLACALYWFNPLVWIAARRMVTERERACDDLVLAAGSPACDYADHVLQIASSLRTSRLIGAAAIAMARPSALEGRLLAILDNRRSRRALTRTAAVVLVVAFAAIILLIGMMRTTASRNEVAAPGQEASAPAGTSASESTSGPMTHTVRPNTFTVSGTVIDATPDYTQVDFDKIVTAKTEEELGQVFSVLRQTDRPAPNAIVRLRSESITREVVVDSAGKFSLTGVPAGEDYDLWAEAPSRLSGTAGKRMATATARIEQLSSSRRVNLQLRADRVILRGRLTDADNRPVAGARVRGEPYPLPETRELTPPTRFAISEADGTYELCDLGPPFGLLAIAGYLNGGDPTRQGQYPFFVEVLVEAEGYGQNTAKVPRVPLVTEEVLDPARRLLKALSHLENTTRRDERLTVTGEKKGLPLPASHGNVITGIDIMLDRRPSDVHVSGRVVDTKGRPRPGRVLSFTASQSGPGVDYVSSKRTIEADTGENGVFDLPHIDPGQYSVLVNGTPANRWYMYQVPVKGSLLEVKPGETLRDVEIVINPPEDFAISGQVRDAKGNPLNGLYVSTSISTGFAWQAMTDSDGNYWIEGLDGTMLSSFKVSFGHHGLAILDVPMNAKNVDLVIPDKGSINGVVRDAKTGRTITSYEVSVPVLKLTKSKAVWENPDVQVELNPDGGFRLLNVPAGQATVHVTAEGLGLQRFTTSVEAGKVGHLECGMIGAAASSGPSTSQESAVPQPTSQSSRPSLWLSLVLGSPIGKLQDFRYTVSSARSLKGVGVLPPFKLVIHPVGSPSRTVHCPLRELDSLLQMVRRDNAQYFGVNVLGHRLGYAEQKALGELVDGEYVAAIYLDDIRCSNVAPFAVDSKYDPAKIAPVELSAIESGPTAFWPDLALRITGPTPKDPDLNRMAMVTAPLVIDGVEHRVIGSGGSGDLYGALPSGSQMLWILHLAYYPPELDPSRPHVVKIKVGKYESNSVTITPVGVSTTRPAGSESDATAKPGVAPAESVASSRSAPGSSLPSEQILLDAFEKGRSLVIAEVLAVRSVPELPGGVKAHYYRARIVRTVVAGDLSAAELAEPVDLYGGAWGPPAGETLKPGATYALFITQERPYQLAWAHRSDFVGVDLADGPSIEALVRTATQAYEKTAVRSFRMAEIADKPALPDLSTSMAAVFDAFRAHARDRIKAAGTISGSDFGSHIDPDVARLESSEERYLPPKIRLSRAQVVFLLGEPTVRSGWTYLWYCGEAGTNTRGERLVGVLSVRFDGKEDVARLVYETQESVGWLRDEPADATPQKTQSSRPQVSLRGRVTAPEGRPGAGHEVCA